MNSRYKKRESITSLNAALKFRVEMDIFFLNLKNIIVIKHQLKENMSKLPFFFVHVYSFTLTRFI